MRPCVRVELSQLSSHPIHNSCAVDIDTSRLSHMRIYMYAGTHNGHIYPYRRERARIGQSPGYARGLDPCSILATPFAAVKQIIYADWRPEEDFDLLIMVVSV